MFSLFWIWHRWVQWIVRGCSTFLESGKFSKVSRRSNYFSQRCMYTSFTLNTAQSQPHQSDHPPIVSSLFSGTLWHSLAGEWFYPSWKKTIAEICHQLRTCTTTWFSSSAPSFSNSIRWWSPQQIAQCQHLFQYIENAQLCFRQSVPWKIIVQHYEWRGFWFELMKVAVKVEECTYLGYYHSK